jgi:glycosyltransferase involved in cell wall biosynthesis
VDRIGVSVNTCVIASYRYGHLAAQAIESVLCQTQPFDRVLFVDDGVGDCAHLPAIYPEVEYTLREQRLGIVDNFNDMLARVETERVMYLGADNWLDHTTLEVTAAVDADIVSYAAWLMKLGRPERWHVEVPHGSSLYRVDKARQVGCYEASGNTNTEEDSVMFARMRGAGASFVNLSDTLLYYRWRHRRNFNR